MSCQLSSQFTASAKLNVITPVACVCLFFPAGRRWFSLSSLPLLAWCRGSASSFISFLLWYSFTWLVTSSLFFPRKGNTQVVELESSRPLLFVRWHHFKRIFPGTVKPLFLPAHHLKIVKLKETGNGSRYNYHLNSPTTCFLFNQQPLPLSRLNVDKETIYPAY